MLDFSKIEGIVLAAGANEASLKIAETKMGITIPQELKTLLMQCNGFSIDGGVLLYSTDELPERNATWETSEYLPGYIAVGDDGGGNVILIQTDDIHIGVFIVGSGSMMQDDFELIGSSLTAWISSGCPF